MKQYYKALWFALAINLLIVVSDRVIAPLHAANRWQGILGYCLGALYILNLPGFTASSFANAHIDQHLSWAGFTASFGVNLLFWSAAAAVCIRFKCRIKKPQNATILPTHPPSPPNEKQNVPFERRRNSHPLPLTIDAPPRSSAPIEEPSPAVACSSTRPAPPPPPA